MNRVSSRLSQCIVGALILAASTLVQSQQQFTQHVSSIMPSDTTLAERWQHVDAVIRCRIESSLPRTIPIQYAETLPPGTDPLAEVPAIVTDHTVTILEVLKGNVRLGAIGTNMSVIQRAGSTVWNGYSITVEGPFDSVFSAGAEYVLFLSFSSSTSSFWASPYYVYRNNGGAVATYNRLDLEALYDGKPWDGFMAMLRSIQ